MADELKELKGELQAVWRLIRFKDDAMALIYEYAITGQHKFPPKIIQAIEHGYGNDEIDAAKDRANPFFEHTEEHKLHEKLSTTEREKQELEKRVAVLERALEIAEEKSEHWWMDTYLEDCIEQAELEQGRGE